MASIGLSLSNSKSIYISIAGKLPIDGTKLGLSIAAEDFGRGKLSIDGTKQKGEINMAKIIIGMIIAGYSGYLIFRQIKNMKAGKFCNSCTGCVSANSCGQFEHDKGNKGQQLG
jgi:hypothetical protein